MFNLQAERRSDPIRQENRHHQNTAENLADH
jgi:hypothetical protein